MYMYMYEYSLQKRSVPSRYLSAEAKPIVVKLCFVFSLLHASKNLNTLDFNYFSDDGKSMVRLLVFLLYFLRVRLHRVTVSLCSVETTTMKNGRHGGKNKMNPQDNKQFARG